MKILYVAIGGSIGAILRYLVSGMAFKIFEKMFPWGTLSVNLIGAAIIGFLYTVFEYYEVDSNLRAFLFVGILGAFTTFSSFCLESVNLIRDGEYKYAALNILVSNISGILLVIAGILLAKVILTKM
ncbi:MAG: fluoride efflux transporter CrcB [Candidatus Marinimicrobia bacterium]|nr:fluoride efflux transporter CrcB [Candidatus Neomarinimicrobiota bacterium]